MEKRYTVSEFVEMWKNEELFIENIIRRTYAPILEKSTVLNIMIEKSVSTTSGGVEFLDSFLLKINFVAAIILLYTNLNIEHDEDDTATFYDDYDLLCQNGIIDMIIEKLSFAVSDDIRELNDVYDKLITSFKERTYSAAAYVSRVTAVLGESVSGYLDTFMQLVEQYQDAVGQTGDGK